MKDIRISPEMYKIISLVSSECEISDEEAIRKIFAISQVVYEKTNGKSLEIRDEDKVYIIDNIR
ncbi:hypothetical protein [Klebsiella phage 05F01]|nr:hypothetical protein [Klebsiella phage 05F01]